MHDSRCTTGTGEGGRGGREGRDLSAPNDPCRRRSVVYSGVGLVGSLICVRCQVIDSVEAKGHKKTRVNK